ncbi:MAG: VanZ family protein [Ruminococcaceae bacterium]|nr:VanZ family protein [Oscillospiraceae bacterium]
MQTGNKSKKASIVFWILTAAVMGLVFYFSSRPADESAMQSNFVLDLLTKLFGDVELSDYIVRKGAHFSEFALLCFLFNWSFYFTCGKTKRILSLCLTSAYAASDEFHQMFVEGRACEIKDWAIDTSGAAAGLFAFIVLLLIVKKIVDRKKQ